MKPFSASSRALRARLAFLSLMGLVAAWTTGELYLSMRESASDTEVRAINQISPDEQWFLQGSFSTPANLRGAYQGPVGNPQAFLETDDELGYHLRPNLRALTGRLRMGGNQLYDVTYSTDRYGWRETPQASTGRGDIFFFGDSYVFGHGLNDEQTIPSRLSEAMKGVALVHNFGVPGWGAQHALRLLELGREKPELMQGRPTKAFFLLIKEHLPRLAGERAESAGAPRYELRAGKPVLAGHFSDGGVFGGLCGYSAVCDWLRTQWRARNVQEDITAAQPAELAAVLAAMQDILKERYGIRLTVISWNLGDKQLDAVEKELLSRGLDVVPARNALPGFPANSPNWVFSFDGHPNADAAKAIAQYLADRLRG